MNYCNQLGIFQYPNIHVPWVCWMYFLFSSIQGRHEIEEIMGSCKLLIRVFWKLTENNLRYYSLILTGMCNHMSSFLETLLWWLLLLLFYNYYPTFFIVTFMKNILHLGFKQFYAIIWNYFTFPQISLSSHFIFKKSTLVSHWAVRTNIPKQWALVRSKALKTVKEAMGGKQEWEHSSATQSTDF